MSNNSDDNTSQNEFLTDDNSPINSPLPNNYRKGRKGRKVRKVRKVRLNISALIYFILSIGSIIIWFIRNRNIEFSPLTSIGSILVSLLFPWLYIIYSLFNSTKKTIIEKELLAELNNISVCRETINNFK